jgi:hypothetical protein
VRTATEQNRYATLEKDIIKKQKYEESERWNEKENRKLMLPLLDDDACRMKNVYHKIKYIFFRDIHSIRSESIFSFFIFALNKFL